jgi:D-sedoheptulose 7-phosphate isomerase
MFEETLLSMKTTKHCVNNVVHGTVWRSQVDTLAGLLRNVSVLNARYKELDIEKGFQLWRDLTIRLRSRKGTVYLIGNGASASMASHYAADLAKNARLHTEVFSDLSLITAISNDMGYENVFAEPLKRRGHAVDMLVAISSSGESRNVLKAVGVANSMGMTVVTLSAMKATNSLRRKGTINFYVAADVYGHAETCHAAILHHWMDMVETGKR